LYSASAISFFALSKSRWPVGASDPALFAIGVPQVKKDGHSFQFCGSPAYATMKSTWSAAANTAWRIFTLSNGV
jgi:hypothetical protein